MLHSPRLDLSPIGLSPGCWLTSLGLGSMSRYAAQTLICIIYVTSEDTIYCTPHQEIQKVRHIRIYRINALSGNAIYVWRIIYTPHQKIQYIVRHIRKYKKYVTSGNTGCAPYQEILCISAEQYIHHFRNEIYCIPHQEMEEISHIRQNRMCTKPGNINTSVISGDPMYCTPHQEIQKVRHIRK